MHALLKRSEFRARGVEREGEVRGRASGTTAVVNAKHAGASVLVDQRRREDQGTLADVIRRDEDVRAEI